MNIQKISKQLLAIALAFVMVFSMLPMQAIAVEAGDPETPIAVTVTGVSLNQSALSLTQGSREILAATVFPEEASDQRVIWTSDNEAVAIVAEGTVTAIAPGEASITATTAAGGYTASCRITVTEAEQEDPAIAVTGIALDQEALSVPLGGYSTLTYTILPENADDQAVVWSSSDEAVATVADGQVTGVSEGTATITVTTADGSFRASVIAAVAGVLTPFGGSAAVSEIHSAEELAAIDLRVDGSYKLAKDITLPSDWTPMVMGNAEGTAAVTFDGNGKTVTLSGTSLFESVYKPCLVKNLIVKGAGSGSGYNTGAIANALSGVIHNCLSYVSVSTTNSYGYAGGVVGAIYSPGSVSNCAYLGSSISGYAVGAIAAGGNSGTTITNCWWLGAYEKADGNGSYGAAVSDSGKAESTAAAIEKINAAAGDGDIRWTLEGGSDATAPANPANVSVTVYHAGTFAKDNDDLLMYQKSVTVTDADSNGQLDMNEALLAAHAAYNTADGYATLWNDTYQSLSVTKFWGVETGATGFYRNHVAAGAVDAEIIAAGDQITAFIYQDTTGWSDRYSYFAADTKEATAGEAITVKLNCWGYDASWNAVISPVANAVLGTINMTTGAFTSLNAATNENGEAEVSFPEAGIYYLTARAAEGDAPLVPPVCVVTVEEAETAAEAPKLTGMSFYAGDLDAGLTPEFNADVLEGYTVTPKPSKSSISIKVTAPEGCTVTANYAGKSDTLSTSGWDSLDGLEGAASNIPVELVVADPATGLSTTYKLTLVYEKESPFDGEGTEDAPYLLKTADDFDTLDDLVEAGETFSGKYFQAAANITMNSGWDGIGYAKIEMQESWGTVVPTATVFKPFAGSFNGNEHTLTFPSGSQPLFDCVRTAAIRNLKIKGSIADDGLIANYAQDGSNATAEISNVTILTGTEIAGSGFLGGYASSKNAVHITDCHIQSGVTIGSENASNIGGFAGDFNGSIKDSTCAATIYGQNFVGGILAGLGQSAASAVSNCTFSGKVIATGNYVGGISGAGYTGTAWGIDSAPNAGCITIQGCTVTGEITGADYVGGILGAEPGVVQCWESGKGEILNNTFTGTLTSNGKYAGGIIGYMKSVNKYNIISGNTYKNTAHGIGGAAYVDTNYENPTEVEGITYVNSETQKPDVSGMTRTAHNRTDDPFGKDAEALTRSLDTEEPTVTKLTVSGDYKNRYNQGESLDLTGAVFTAKWSDGTTTHPELSDVTVTGYDAQKSGTQVLTAAYKGAACSITVNVIAASVETTIKVTFSMLACSAHGDDGNVHTLKGGGLSTWIPATQYTMKTGSTVLDLLDKACSNNGISYSYASGYVSSVTKGGVTLASFTNGPKSGWMYTFNGDHTDYTVVEQKLSNGAVVVFHYTDDYTKEEDGDSAGGSAATEKTAAEKVMDLIRQIGAVSYTLECKQRIDAARAAYNALSAADKRQVTNIAALEAAEKTYADLKKADDQKHADAVDDLISKIKEPITRSSEQSIQAARAAYNKLTADQKKLVKNLKTLTDAEAKLAALKASDQDREKAQKVIDLIAAIGEVTAESAEKIQAAREAYDKLTDLQKALVTNYDVLEAAERIFARLQELQDFVDSHKDLGELLARKEKPIGSDWIVLGLIRSGMEINEDYYQLLVAYIRENADEQMRLHKAKSSDNSRTILILTALGYDATDVEGYNLVAGLNSMEYICKQGINGAFWALIALDSGNYPAPGETVTREKLVQTILDAQLSDGGWALSGETSDPDMTGMALQALTPYYEAQTASDVNKAVEDALAYLSRIQNSDGSFSAGNVPTAESSAQVIVALTALGIDPDTDERFLKNGASALDALLKFYVPGEGFAHIMDGGVNGVATEQGYYALTAYDRFLNSKTRLYDMTDILDLGGGIVAEEKTEAAAAVVIPEETPVSEEPGFFQWLLSGIKDFFARFTDK